MNNQSIVKLVPYLKEWRKLAEARTVLVVHPISCCAGAAKGRYCPFSGTSGYHKTRVDANKNHYCTSMKLFCDNNKLDYSDFYTTFFSVGFEVLDKV